MNEGKKMENAITEIIPISNKYITIVSIKIDTNDKTTQYWKQLDSQFLLPTEATAWLFLQWMRSTNIFNLRAEEEEEKGHAVVAKRQNFRLGLVPETF